MDTDTRLALSVLRDTVKSLKVSFDKVANALERASTEIIETNYGESQCHRETMVLAAEALREQAERSKGCEHCRGWDSRCGANYCPMCGKRLEVKHGD